MEIKMAKFLRAMNKSCVTSADFLFKAELLQLNPTQFIYLGICVNKKVGNLIN